MINNRSKGFTLIELLVVIAIIGVLSAVVLASLSTARSKGNDAAIRSDLSSIQTQAEIFYGNSGNKYNTDGTTGVTATPWACPTSGNTMFGSDSTIKNAIAAADSTNGAGTLICTMKADGSAYAINAALTAPNAGYFCVDSTGNATSTQANTLSAGSYSC
jgi:prepilin-type N-terminal cleavage/methylation domain-containing protein